MVVPESVEANLTCRSFAPVTLRLSTLQQQISRNEESHFKGAILFEPESELAQWRQPKCGGWWRTEPVGSSTATLWGVTGCYQVSTRHWKCNSGCCKQYFDGRSVGVFHKSSGHLFTHSLLLSYLWETIYSGTTFIGFANTTNMKYESIYGMEGRLMDVRQFQWAFIAFTSLLETTDLPFSCDICGLYPSVFGFDGTDLATPAKWSKLPRLRDDSLGHSKNKIVPFRDRLVVRHPEVRSALKSLCRESTKSEVRAAIEVMESLDKEMADFVHHLVRQKGGIASLPAVYFDLLRLLSSRTALCRILHSKDYDLFESFLAGCEYDKEKHMKFKLTSPLLAAVMETFRNGIAPEWMKPMLWRIYHACAAVFTEEGNGLDDNGISMENVEHQLREADGIVWKAWEKQPQRKMMWYPQYDTAG